MNKAKFIISINEAEELLKIFGLYKSKGPKGNGIYSKEYLTISKKNNLVESYKCAIENKDYDFLLQDDSLIQFQMLGEDLRYVFMQNPYKFVSREQYLQELFLPDELLELTKFFNLEEIINENEYEQFLNEQALNSTSNYFRYDCSPVGYFPLVHSYSHIHVGPNNDVRIPTSIILTPRKFTKFCIKNTYYAKWKEYFVENENFVNDVVKFKKDCITLPSEKWCINEKNELYLS